MFVMWIKNEKELGVFKRFVLPATAIVACAFMVFAAVYAHGITPFMDAQAKGEFSFPVLFYLIIFAVVMLLGFVFKNGNPFANKTEANEEDSVEE